MVNIDFNTYIITDDNISLEEQFFYLKKLKNYKYKKEIGIQIRFNNETEQNIISFAKELQRELVDIRLIINNSIKIMNELDLDGVHLKENINLKDIKIKKYQNKGKLIIKSTHSLKSLKEAEIFNLNAVTYGPVFDTPSKRKYGKPNGYNLIKNNKFNIPIFALGGINMDNIQELKTFFYGIGAIRLFVNKDIIKNIMEVRDLWK